METVNLNQALSWFNLEELHQLKEDVTDNFVASLKEVHKPTKTTDSDLMWVRRTVYECKVNQIMDYYKKLGRRINGCINHIEWPEAQQQGVSQIQIDLAREYPIADLITTPIKGGMTVCPFHQDDTASLSIRRHNRYRCFGCEERGDVIQFYMKIHNVPFITAVNALSPTVS